MKKKLNNTHKVRRGLHRNFRVSDIIKKPMTTKSDLEFLAKKLNIDPLRIVWLKDADPYYKEAQIINLGNPYGVGGSHWTCTYDGKYYDSFGLVPPTKFEDAGYEWVPLQLQKASEGYCGNWCILWLYYAKINELDKFYSQFNILN